MDLRRVAYIDTSGLNAISVDTERMADGQELNKALKKSGRTYQLLVANDLIEKKLVSFNIKEIPLTMWKPTAV